MTKTSASVLLINKSELVARNVQVLQYTLLFSATFMLGIQLTISDLAWVDGCQELVGLYPPTKRHVVARLGPRQCTLLFNFRCIIGVPDTGR
ncbi:hypothetical protein G6011_04777 [Alternaria panax]|uniref:Uncharacterized protein n=1 Tax=Alternaria panax TaxID=48097 RepID=A0AAD4IH55_9PLEO|nr:hypothetical protein G6011_04777 [Alternaria panax]